MKQGYFITGTDTGVGKTVFTAGLTCWLRRQGCDAVPMKPVQTGAAGSRGGWHAPDLEFCLHLAGLTPAPDEKRCMRPFCYGPACSPHLAARAAGGRYPDLSKIKSCAARLQAGHDVVLAEGAGGVLVPISKERTILDLMQALSWPVILVAPNVLGAINHALLSIAALRSRRLDIAGFVLNEALPGLRPDAWIRADNPRAIARFGGVRHLGTLRRIRRPSRTSLLRAFQTDLAPGLRRLFRTP
jgi:dethiobiotin synthase